MPIHPLTGYVPAIRSALYLLVSLAIAFLCMTNSSNAAQRKDLPSVTVLADTAIRGGDLDEAKALEAKKQAEELMLKKESKIDYAKAQAEMAAAIAQLAAIQKLRSRGR